MRILEEIDCPRPNVFDLRDIIRRHTIMLAMAFLLGFLARLSGHYSVSDYFGYVLLGNFIFIALIWNSNLFLLDVLDKVLKWEENFRLKIILICLIALSLPIATHYFFVNVFCFVLPLEKCGYADNKVVDLIISVSITLLVNAIYAAVAFFVSWRKTMEEKEELKRDSISAEFETLKNQINPHFLFNSLNTLSSLIDENPKTANEFVQKLSSVYRYVLTQKDKETVSLREELNFIESYLYLNRIRFGENLSCKIDVPEKYLENKIATLTLQMLIENCIKHNVISQNKPLLIEIGIEGNFVIVKNNLQPKITLNESNGIGLSNIIHRYKLLGKEEVEVIENSSAFIVKIPML